MHDIKGILFDKDGTLLNFNRTWLTPYRRAAEYLQQRFGDSAGHCADADNLLASGGFIAESQTWRADSPLASADNQEILALWERVVGQSFGATEREALRDIFSLPEHACALAVDDLAGLLLELRSRDMLLGLATMDSEANAHKMLRAAGVSELFDFVCGADSGYGLKPQAGMVMAFCDACDLTCDEVAMVGDSPWDLQMGKNAEVALCVGVLTGAHGSAALQGYADVVLPSIAELPTVLK